MQASKGSRGGRPAAGRWPSASDCLAGFFALGLLLYPVEIDAQSTGSLDRSASLRIAAPATITPLDTGQARLEFEVSPVEALPPNSFVRIRGLPEAGSLSEGYAVALGVWAVPLRALASLKATLPQGLSGRAPLTVQLVSADGAVLAETTTVLSLEVAKAPAAPPQAAKRVVAPPPPIEATPPRPRLSAEERQRAEKLVVQGDRYLESGNVAIARQFFQRAADMGLALGALRLAATFDPNELSRLGTQGVVPSPADARHWYERAKLLGAPEADERLARLTN